MHGVPLQRTHAKRKGRDMINEGVKGGRDMLAFNLEQMKQVGKNR